MPGQTDGRTDTRQMHRPRSAYYACSANKCDINISQWQQIIFLYCRPVCRLTICINIPVKAKLYDPVAELSFSSCDLELLTY